jgi:hypothetical protein
LDSPPRAKIRSTRHSAGGFSMAAMGKSPWRWTRRPTQKKTGCNFPWELGKGRTWAPKWHGLCVYTYIVIKKYIYNASYAFTYIYIIYICTYWYIWYTIKYICAYMYIFKYMIWVRVYIYVCIYKPNNQSPPCFFRSRGPIGWWVKCSRGF